MATPSRRSRVGDETSPFFGHRPAACIVLVPALLLATMATLIGACASRGPVPPMVAPGPSVTPAGASRAVRELGQDLTQLFARSPVAQGVWGVQVRSLDRNETLYRLNDRTLLMPASTLKLLTLAAAAERLGWNFRYETQLLSAATVERGSLTGDLIVRGTGDPTINTPDGGQDDLFARWADELRAIGIQRIEGRIIGDDRALSSREDELWSGLGVGWAWDDLPFGFAARGGALQQHENVAELVLQPGPQPGTPATAQVDHATSGLELVNRVVTGEPDDELTLGLHRLPGQPTLVLTGSIPANGQAVRRRVSVDNPTTFFVGVLRQSLELGGITVAGDALDIDELPPEEHLYVEGPHRALAVHWSPPLSEIAVDMMKRSQNLYAETLLRTLGGQASEGSTTGGQGVIADLLELWGVDDHEFILADGSGLSRYNLLTANVLVEVLDRIHASARHANLFKATLPIAGLNGTLESRMVGTAASGNARGKTGTMANVRALAGYVETRDGEHLAFAILANNFSIPPAEIIETIDQAVVQLVGFGRE